MSPDEVIITHFYSHFVRTRLTNYIVCLDENEFIGLLCQATCQTCLMDFENAS